MFAQSPEPGAHVTNARLFKSTMDKDQSTTPGTTRPTLYDVIVGFIKISTIMYSVFILLSHSFIYFSKNTKQCIEKMSLDSLV